MTAMMAVADRRMRRSRLSNSPPRPLLVELMGVAGLLAEAEESCGGSEGWGGTVAGGGPASAAAEGVEESGADKGTEGAGSTFLQAGRVPREGSEERINPAATYFMRCARVQRIAVHTTPARLPRTTA